MTLNERLLEKLADWRPARGSRQILAVPDEGSGWAVSLTVDRHDEAFDGVLVPGADAGTWPRGATRSYPYVVLVVVVRPPQRLPSGPIHHR